MLGELTSQEKKRKVAEGVGTPAAAGAAGSGSAAFVSSGAGQGAAPSWATVAGRAPMGGPSVAGATSSAAGKSGGARDDGRRERVVPKRLQPVMRDRLPVFLPSLFAHVNDSVVRVQGPTSGTRFTLVLNSEEVATALLQLRQETPFTGVFEPEGPAVPVTLQLDRERWLQKYLTMQWPVLEYLRTLATIENASMNKFRVGDRRHAQIYVKEEGREVLRLIGVGEYKEYSEDGPEPNEFVPGEGVGEVGKGVRRAMGLAEDV